MIPTKSHMHRCWERGFPLKQKDLKTFHPYKKIRKRFSYAFWKAIVDDVNILRAISLNIFCIRHVLKLVSQYTPNLNPFIKAKLENLFINQNCE